MDWNKISEHFPLIGLMTNSNQPWLYRIGESVIISAMTAAAVIYTSDVKQAEQINELNNKLNEFKIDQQVNYRLIVEARDMAQQAATRSQLQQDVINRNSQILDNMRRVETREHGKDVRQ